MRLISSLLKLIFVPVFIIIIFIECCPKQSVYYAGGTIQIYGLFLVIVDLYKINRNHDYYPVIDIKNCIKKYIARLFGKKQVLKQDSIYTERPVFFGGSITKKAALNLTTIAEINREIKELESRLEKYTREQLNKEKEARQKEIKQIYDQLDEIKEKIRSIQNSLKEKSVSEFKIEFSGFILLTIGILLSTWSEPIAKWSFIDYISIFNN